MATPNQETGNVDTNASTQLQLPDVLKDVADTGKEEPTTLAKSRSDIRPPVLSKQTQASLVTYMRNVLIAKHAFTSFRNKLAAVDVAYAAYQIKNADLANPDGVDVDSVLQNTDTTINVVASQVDTIVASLVETFLSGSPLFPVVSGPKTREVAEKFEAVLDDHSRKGRYMRQLVLAIKDAAKYDFTAVEHIWDTISPFNPAQKSPFEILANTTIPLTTLRRLDPYNTIWDYRVAPADVSADGEFAGDIQLLSMNALKRYLNKLSNEETSSSMNVASALKSKLEDVGTVMSTPVLGDFDRSYNYTLHPTISDYITMTNSGQGTNWDAWFSNDQDTKTGLPSYSGMYEKVTLYARIIPSAHHMEISRPNTPQIWKLVLINAQHLVEARPITSPYDHLPISIGQPLEDGLLYQTKSLAERSIPFQKAASDLYNVKINSSKRAINDRMLYDSRYIDEMDINTGVPAAKIPVNLGMNKSIRDVVQTIPFDDRATGGALVDLQQTLQMANLVNGLNPFRQGQTIKGNRTKAEFAGVVDSSELRTRLVALMLEVHLFMPIKDVLKLNIILHNKVLTVVSLKEGGQEVSLTPQEVQTAILEFKVADGVNPKDKLMSTEDLQAAFTFLAQDQTIGIQYDLGGMFVHLMSLRGVHGLEDYKFTEESKQAIIAKAAPFIQELIQKQQNQPITDQTTPAKGGNNQQ